VSTPLPLITDPQDIALASDGDIFIDADGLRFTAGIQAVQQAVQITLNLLLGEWFLNQDVGMPYLQELMGDPSKQAGYIPKASVIIAGAILGVPGITSIEQLTVSLNDLTRALTVVWAANCVFGEIPATTLTTVAGL
jgi:hypothetical protein